MAEVVKAWGTEYFSYESDPEGRAERTAKTAVKTRLETANMAAIDDIMIVKTQTKQKDRVGTISYRCQAAVRAVRK
jgi:hypothetical protein